jgi:hypothetical protein
MKTCNKCNEIKSFNEFYIRVDSVDGYRNDCKKCNAQCSKTYAQNNKESTKEYKNSVERINADPKLKIIKSLRNRINKIITRNQRGDSAVSDLSCSIEEFKLYIEQRFYFNPNTCEVMSWDNYGIYGWRIEYIIPLASFDLTDRKQLLKACHYTNLQPLWAEDNLQKSDKIL